MIILVALAIVPAFSWLKSLWAENIKIEIAAQDGDMPTLRQLIKANPSLVSSKYYIGTHWTPLHVAAAKGHEDAAAFLLISGADINAKDSEGQTSLHYAALYGNKDVVDLLLANKADVNLFDAAIVGDLEKVTTMIKANPDLVSSRDAIGMTSLHWAAAAGHSDVIEYLLANKADVNVAGGKGGATPLDNAAAYGHKEAVEVLIAHKANVNARRSNGNTPIDGAVWMNQRDVVEVLLANNADVNARNNDGKTPLDLATEVQQVTSRGGRMAELLRQHGGHE